MFEINANRKLVNKNQDGKNPKTHPVAAKNIAVLKARKEEKEKLAEKRKTKKSLDNKIKTKKKLRILKKLLLK